MLVNLKIKNVALIKEADIDFDKGLNVLSGETGSGKSVVLEALNFALGQKADKSMICYGEKECLVSCVFDLRDNLQAKNALEEIGVDIDDEIIVKRTLNIDGKSVIRLNGETITATMLRKVTSHLVDVHGQSDHFALLKEGSQLALIDSLGGGEIQSTKDEIVKVIRSIKEIDENLSKLGGDEESRTRKLDYLSYSIKEIENAELSENEEEELLLRKKKVINSEKIITGCSESIDALTGENGAADLLGIAGRKMESLSNLSEEYADLSNRIEVVLDEINDISDEISNSFETDYDESELDRIETRISQITALKKKYGKSFAEIMGTYNSLTEEYDLISDSSERSEKLVLEREKLTKILSKRYDALCSLRLKTADALSSKLSLKLKELAMKGADFKIDFERADEDVLSYNGRESVRFMFTANKGEELKPLSKVISGGELSRLMLAIKAVTGGNFGSDTFIFDEIDVGISGDTALVVAENFAKIALNKQIIAISHLPQIIAMTDSGFLISKSELGERTVTTVKKLDLEGKIGEVVRLVGGNKESLSARAHALEMIENSNKFKSTL